MGGEYIFYYNIFSCLWAVSSSHFVDAGGWVFDMSIQMDDGKIYKDIIVIIFV